MRDPDKNKTKLHLERRYLECGERPFPKKYHFGHFLKSIIFGRFLKSISK